MTLESDLIRRYQGDFTPEDCEECIKYIEEFEEFMINKFKLLGGYGKASKI